MKFEFPQYPEISDDAARQMTAEQLLHSPATFHHRVQEDGSWTVAPVNAPAREIMTRLKYWEQNHQ